MYYGPGTVTGEAGRYLLVTDFAKYKVKEDPSGKRLVGVGLRITADVTTRKAGVNIGVNGLGAALKIGDATGSLSFDMHGASSKWIDQLWPKGKVNIDEVQVQRVIDARDQIRTALRQPETRIVPVLLASQRMEHDARLPLTSDQSGEVAFSVKKEGIYPRAKSVPNTEDKDTDLYQVPVVFNAAFSRAPTVQIAITGLNLSSNGGWFIVRAVNIAPGGFDIQLKHWKQTPKPDVLVVSWTAFDKERLGGQESQLETRVFRETLSIASANSKDHGDDTNAKYEVRVPLGANGYNDLVRNIQVGLGETVEDVHLEPTSHVGDYSSFNSLNVVKDGDRGIRLIAAVRSQPGDGGCYLTVRIYGTVRKR